MLRRARENCSVCSSIYFDGRAMLTTRLAALLPHNSLFFLVESVPYRRCLQRSSSARLQWLYWNYSHVQCYQILFDTLLEVTLGAAAAHTSSALPIWGSSRATIPTATR